MRYVNKIKRWLIQYWFMTFPKYVCYCKQAGPARREWFCYRWLRKHIDWVDSSWQELNIEKEVPMDVVLNKTIFVYWRQGFENAPPLVKKCLESLKRFAGSYNLVCLTEENLHKYVLFPQHIEKKYKQGLIGEAHYSDLIRAYLLYRYGGIWCDATCFLSSPIEEYVWDSSFFMFQNTKLGYISPIKCSSWFMKAERGCLLLKGILNYLYSYHIHQDILIHYYLFHIVLSLIVDEKKELANEWNDMPFVCNMDPHVFLFSLGKIYEESAYQHILNSCFIHKLTYKFDKSLLSSKKENMLQHFLCN